MTRRRLSFNEVELMVQSHGYQSLNWPVPDAAVSEPSTWVCDECGSTYVGLVNYTFPTEACLIDEEPHHRALCTGNLCPNCSPPDAVEQRFTLEDES